MKLNDLALVIIFFLIISFVLLAFDIIPVAITDVLAYSLIVIGIALVYTETIRQNKLSVFIGTIIFLFGIYFLITENFNLSINEDIYIYLILIFIGAGLLLIYLSTNANKIYLYISLVSLSSGITLVISKSHWKISSFLQSILPVIDFIWPIIIILLIIIFIMRVK